MQVDNLLHRWLYEICEGWYLHYYEGERHWNWCDMEYFIGKVSESIVKPNKHACYHKDNIKYKI